jgi:hypothetical protein
MMNDIPGLFQDHHARIIINEPPILRGKREYADEEEIPNICTGEEPG